MSNKSVNYSLLIVENNVNKTKIIELKISDESVINASNSQGRAKIVGLQLKDTHVIF